jgi:ABC-type glycerol-3-phosphate transport system permease component
VNVSGGGAVFAAFVIATMPMFVLIGFTMRYFVSGLTEGALKL